MLDLWSYQTIPTSIFKQLCALFLPGLQAGNSIDVDSEYGIIIYLVKAELVVVTAN